MAYYPEDEREQEDESPQSGGAVGAAGGGGNPGGMAPGPGPRFVNLTSYLAANRVPAENQANRVIGSVENRAQEAKTGLDGAVTTFNDQVAQAGSRTTYDGPDSLEDVQGFGKVADNVEGVQRDIDSLSNSGTIQRLQGGNKYDAFLTQQAGAQGISGVRQRFGGLSSYMGKSNEQSGVTSRVGRQNSQAAASAYEVNARAKSEAERLADEAEAKRRDLIPSQEASKKVAIQPPKRFRPISKQYRDGQTIANREWWQKNEDPI